MNRNWTIVILGALGLVIIVAFLALNRPASEGEPISTEAPSAQVLKATEIIMPTQTSPVQEEAAEATAAEVTEESPVPTARVGLQATDPGLVNLASGEIQLVEFFAFW